MQNTERATTSPPSPDLRKPTSQYSKSEFFLDKCIEVIIQLIDSPLRACFHLSFNMNFGIKILTELVMKYYSVSMGRNQGEKGEILRAGNEVIHS